MKAIIQRVSEASVTIDGKIHASIQQGFLVLLGVHKEDTQADAEWIARKIAGMRIFPDSEGKINTTLTDIGGEILAISQFTLISSTRKGNRPSFNDAAKAEKGNELYEATVSLLEKNTSRSVKKGIFGADMKVALINDGPVTITLDTRNRE